MIVNIFSHDNFHQICDELAATDADLRSVIRTYGYPPMWKRSNTFESLVHIILEQQVSLASALAALNKLRDRLKEVTPGVLLQLTDEELKACYLSRQKSIYVRHLATSILHGSIDLDLMPRLPDREIRILLNQLKGVGNWTIDVYLMFVLQRADVFPSGDLAAVNALKQLKDLPVGTHKEVLERIAMNWQPYRTVATMILWHYYLSRRSSKTAGKPLRNVNPD
ncbi:3-methyladenine DNA glycosylase [Pedobacter sp. BAL39]|uniref:DNA-3-methyladenine glycosylase family protein n=1 Tax=Pedobacter sp. BAL39 TaxID=391596 RepID=UPI000155963E|nr:DNA-3-methyladenine glycosylase [Pedobacter sp. BAL39]EDM36171.1 3-methyladenine DNA glycosylase [Pedobacter sp. BAL39]